MKNIQLVFLIALFAFASADIVIYKSKRCECTSFIKSECDKWQICGAAPIYSLMQIKEFSNAELEYYGQYLDYEFDSAVSFATISFQ